MKKASSDNVSSSMVAADMFGHHGCVFQVHRSLHSDTVCVDRLFFLTGHECSYNAAIQSSRQQTTYGTFCIAYAFRHRPR